MQELTDIQERRDLQCPVCGHRARSTGIGAVYCGPHRYPKPNDPDGSFYTPAVRMRELEG